MTCNDLQKRGLFAFNLNRSYIVSESPKKVFHAYIVVIDRKEEVSVFEVCNGET